MTETSPSTRPRVLIVSLGGTITMTKTGAGGIAPTLDAADLVATVPQLDHYADIETISPFRLPGASLTLSLIADVARQVSMRLASDCDGAVIIQGTDTIEETAWVFDCLINGDKPVIVTGAMRGADTAGADGPANILAAVTVASAKAARGLGCLVVLNDQIHAARYVQKSHTTLPSAFTSGELGSLGLVIEGKAHILTKIERLPPMPMPTNFSPQVALLTVGLGDDGRLLRELPRLGYQAVVLAAMGVGHVPSNMVPSIEATVMKMPVVLASRVPNGPTLRDTYGFSGSERDLLSRGVWSAGYLSALKARLLLSMLLDSGLSARSVDQFLKYGFHSSAQRT